MKLIHYICERDISKQSQRSLEHGRQN
jgi:hypothetical protein